MRVTKTKAVVVKEPIFVAYRCDLCGREWKQDRCDWVLRISDVHGSVHEGEYGADLCADCGQRIRDALLDLGVQLVFLF